MSWKASDTEAVHVNRSFSIQDFSQLICHTKILHAELQCPNVLTSRITKTKKKTKKKVL